jgi:hypothetical protein
MFSPHPGRQQPAFNYVIILHSYSAKNRLICQSQILQLLNLPQQTSEIILAYKDLSYILHMYFM